MAHLGEYKEESKTAEWQVDQTQELITRRFTKTGKRYCVAVVDADSKKEYNEIGRLAGN